MADGKTGKRSQNTQLNSFPELQQLPGGGAVEIKDLYSVYEKGFLVGGSRQRARDLGVKDAKSYGRRVSKDEIKTWPEVKSGDLAEAALFVIYNDAFEAQNKTRVKVMERARQLGYKDGKTGTKTDLEVIFKWPEVGQLLKDGAVGPDLFRELRQSYEDAFDVQTGKKDQYEGLEDDKDW